jgi:hypothetical protein
MPGFFLCAAVPSFRRHGSPLTRLAKILLQRWRQNERSIAEHEINDAKAPYHHCLDLQVDAEAIAHRNIKATLKK